MSWGLSLTLVREEKESVQVVEINSLRDHTEAAAVTAAVTAVVTAAAAAAEQWTLTHAP